MIKSPHFIRDASHRLAHDRPDIDSLNYPEVCRKVADHFSLRSSSELIVGPDQVFQDFSDGAALVELAWDNWLCFTVTAKEPSAESLVHRIATFLSEVIPPKMEQ